MAWSTASERAYALALARYANWILVRGPEFSEQASRIEAFTAFLSDVRNGTIKNLEDPSGLWWKPTSFKNAQGVANRIAKFSDWLSEKYGIEVVNPYTRRANFAEQLVFWRGWAKHKEGSLLGHLDERAQVEERSHFVREAKVPGGRRNQGMDDPKAFPLELIEPLLLEGFINRGERGNSDPLQRLNVRDLLITLLCLFGGCRISEPMHLWVTDINPSPIDPYTEPLLIYEPTDGAYIHRDDRTGVRKRMTRGEYLAIVCAKKPLTEESGRRHAGWKGALLHDPERSAFRVFWISREAAELFYALWGMYLSQRPMVLRTPWAFLTRDSQPLGVDGFEDSFRAAIRRIGSHPNKLDGTTPHGLRHRYARFFNDLPFEEVLTRKIVQVALHHLSPLSQDVYRKHGMAGIAQIISEIRVKQIPTLSQLLSH